MKKMANPKKAANYIHRSLEQVILPSGIARVRGMGRRNEVVNLLPDIFGNYLGWIITI